jgi:hypothetical protein
VVCREVLNFILVCGQKLYGRPGLARVIQAALRTLYQMRGWLVVGHVQYVVHWGRIGMWGGWLWEYTVLSSLVTKPHDTSQNRMLTGYNGES